jgi:hypothetical protein
VITAFAFAVMVKVAAGLRSGLRALGRWTGAYFRERAVQESARRAELWWRLRTDRGAATELWIRLNNELLDHAQMRDLLDRLRREHPEYAPYIDGPQQRTRAELERLEETVQHVHGGWG